MKGRGLLPVLTASILMVSLWSCDSRKNENELFRSIVVSIADNSSRAADSPLSEGVTSRYGNLSIYFTDGERVLFHDIITDSREVETFRIEGKVYPNVTASVKEVVIVANAKDGAELPVENGRPVSEITDTPLPLSMQQPDSDHPENSAAEGIRVTMIGKAQVSEATAPVGNGTVAVKADVTLRPLVARLEIYGMPGVGTGIHFVKVVRLFLNGYYVSRSFVPSAYLLKGQNIYDYTGNISGAVEVFSPDNVSVAGKPARVDAHHLFSDDTSTPLPHIVLELEGSYDNGAGGEGVPFSRKYITVTSYREAKIMYCGNVYKVDLTALSLSADMLDPVPEAGRVTLEISVGIEEWNEYHSFPEV